MSAQQWLYKIPDRKINFCSKFAVNTLPLINVNTLIIANANIESLKSLNTFLEKYLYPMLEKFELKIDWSKPHEILSFVAKRKKNQGCINLKQS